MTDRIKGFTVILDQDIRDDDVEIIRQAIGMIKRVKKVENVLVTHDDYMIEQRTKMNIKEKFLKFINEI